MKAHNREGAYMKGKGSPLDMTSLDCGANRTVLNFGTFRLRRLQFFKDATRRIRLRNWLTSSPGALGLRRLQFFKDSTRLARLQVFKDST